MYGKHLSEETKKKLSDALKGRQLSEETKQRISIARKGITFSEETKKKLSEANKGEKHPHYGKIWVNNGVIQKLVKYYEIPEGFVRGRKIIS